MEECLNLGTLYKFRVGKKLSTLRAENIRSQSFNFIVKNSLTKIDSVLSINAGEETLVFGFSVCFRLSGTLKPPCPTV